MSYCRWSTNDFQCDLYCYEDVGGGWTTHVACKRLLLPDNVPPPVAPPKDDSPAEHERWANEWLARHAAMRPIIDAAKRVPIGLPYDGESFNDPDLKSFLDRLLHLREVGYVFPDYVLDRVREEMTIEQPRVGVGEEGVE